MEYSEQITPMCVDAWDPYVTMSSAGDIQLMKTDVLDIYGVNLNNLTKNSIILEENIIIHSQVYVCPKKKNQYVISPHLPTSRGPFC